MKLTGLRFKCCACHGGFSADEIKGDLRLVTERKGREEGAYFHLCENCTSRLKAVIQEHGGKDENWLDTISGSEGDR